MFKTYLKPAWKAIWKNKSVSSINIIGLSAGITAAVFVLLWVQNELSFDNYHPDAKNIYRITSVIQVNKDEKWTWENSPLLLGDVAKKEIPAVEKTARVYPSIWQPITFTVNSEVFSEKHGAYVDKGWFDMFHYDFVDGNPKGFNEDPYSVILSETKAKKYFGSNEAVGKYLKIDNVNYTVQAVIKDNPANSSFQYDVMIPVDAYLSDSDQRKNSLEWGNFNFITFLQLHPGNSPAKVSQQLRDLIFRYKKDSSASASLQPLTGMHFENDLQSSVMEHADKKTVYIFGIIALLLVVTACINYVNLTTARASLRVKEISIRKIAGAQRRQLFVQFITESALIGLISLCITLVLVKVCLPLFDNLTEKNFVLPLTSVALWKVLGSTLIFATLLNSIYPATLLSSFNPLNTFRGINFLRVKDGALRKGLVVFQFTLAVVLIASTIIISRQLHFIQSANPGYDRAQVLSFNVPYKTHSKNNNLERKALVEALKADLLNESAIADVALANQPIVNNISTSSGSADWDGRAKDYNPTLSQLSVDDRFQKLFKLQLKEGRWFDKSQPGDKHNFILNQTAVEQLKIHIPVLGQRFAFHGDTGVIIGVADDFHYASLHDKIGPVVIFNGDRWHSYVFVKTYPGKASAAVKAAEAVWKKYLPDDVFDYTFLDDSFNSLYKSDLKVSSLTLLFSVVVIIISSLGLFALSAFTAEQRIKEIGIRKVLGATVANITMLLSKDFVKLVAIAVIIATPIAWWAMSKWLEDFAYRIQMSWWIFVLAGVLSLFIALITISFQAIRAALANPVIALKNE